jgi:hypothetical protein
MKNNSSNTENTETSTERGKKKWKWRKRELNTLKLEGSSYIDKTTRRLKLKPETIAALTEGESNKKRLKTRMERLNSPARIMRIELEESLLAALQGMLDVYRFVKDTSTRNGVTALVDRRDYEMYSWLRDRCHKLKMNVYRKRDRMKRPLVYSDINNRYQRYLRDRSNEK